MNMREPWTDVAGHTPGTFSMQFIRYADVHARPSVRLSVRPSDLAFVYAFVFPHANRCRMRSWISAFPCDCSPRGRPEDNNLLFLCVVRVLVLAVALALPSVPARVV